MVAVLASPHYPTEDINLQHARVAQSVIAVTTSLSSGGARRPTLDGENSLSLSARAAEHTTRLRVHFEPDAWNVRFWALKQAVLGRPCSWLIMAEMRSSPAPLQPPKRQA